MRLCHAKSAQRFINSHRRQLPSLSFHSCLSRLVRSAFYFPFMPLFNILYENFYQFAFRAIECEINYIANLLWLIYILAFSIFPSTRSPRSINAGDFGGLSVFVVFPPVCTHIWHPRAHKRARGHIPQYQYEILLSLFFFFLYAPRCRATFACNTLSKTLDLQLEFDLTSSRNSLPCHSYKAVKVAIVGISLWHVNL